MDMKNKLETPARVSELNPKGTLKQIGLKNGDTFCDVGAGTGIFTFAAAEITNNKIYAVEISDEMLELLQLRAKEKKFENVVAAKGVEEVSESSCNVVLFCTVLHEVPDLQNMMNEIRRILVKDGILSVIEFHKRPTPMGPPVEKRLDSLKLAGNLHDYGLYQVQQFTLGENFYCSVFKLEGSNV